MQRSEFENLTEIYPPENLYSVIEKFYNDGELDKKDFCMKYIANADGLAEKIQSECNQLDLKKEQEFFSRIGDLEAKLEETQKALESEKRTADHLRKRLDEELEWHPALHTGTNMKQSDYEELANQSYDQTDEEHAKYMLSSLFGFIENLIVIHHHAETFEVNKYHRIRRKETYQRDPYYAASDWNYIRFDCAGCQWELVNGALLPYED
ncbi:MAG: hypothetical protein IJ642_11515 [Oscillospiraceae bacterium]|nr:hypothetical protein [Oscillospiraceae bacterium]